MPIVMINTQALSYFIFLYSTSVDTLKSDSTYKCIASNRVIPSSFFQASLLYYLVNNSVFYCSTYHFALPTTSNKPGLCVLIFPSDTCL